MNRLEKEQEVERLRAKFLAADFTILAEYSGLTVAQITSLRNSLREVKADLKVVKNTLAKRALDGTGVTVLSEYFSGSTAVVFVQGDPVGPAKLLSKFSKDFEKWKMKAGALSGNFLGVGDIEEISKLPSREHLLAQFLGSLQAPAQNFVRVLSALPQKLVFVLDAVRNKKQS